MRNALTITVGVVVVIILLVRMFFFTVRYDEMKIITFFSSAEPPQWVEQDADGDGEIERVIDPDSPGSVRIEPGPYWRLPWPIHNVYTYSRKLQLLEAQQEELQTSDNFSVVLRSYVLWRIQDPHAFFVKLQNMENAKAQLRPLLGNTRAIVGQYEFEQLVNQDPAQLKLQELEAEIQEELQARLDEKAYGIEVAKFGIRRVVLPQGVTQQVFERMKENRQALAADAKASGQAQATAIRSQAALMRDRILDFAVGRAEAIRARGDQEAAESYALFNRNPKLAIFLREMDTLRETLKQNTTFVLSPQTFSLLQPFVDPPGSGDTAAPQLGAGAPADPPAADPAEGEPRASIELAPSTGTDEPAS